MARPKGSKNIVNNKVQETVMEQLVKLNEQRIDEFANETVNLINKYGVSEREFRNTNREIEF